MSKNEGHNHDHAAGITNRARLVVAIAIVGVFLVVEVVGAVLSGSLALLADSGHMLSDLLGLVVALVALSIAARPATDRQTFGYQRAEVFGALLNGVLLAGVAIFVAVEGIGRLFRPESAEVLSAPMLVIAVVGLAANVASLLVLRGGVEKGGSIGMRGAYLEVLGDLFGSVATIIAAVVIITTGLVQADAVASLVIAALIVPRAFSLLRDVFHVLSESVPTHMNIEEIRQHLLGTPGVVDVHDVHVWAITSGAPVFSAHIVVSKELFEAGGVGALLDELSGCLTGHFDVEHSTFQIEPTEHAAHEDQLHR
ncbi:cobalt-zinc-cadmium efflux system protein [Conyzicola lurida]|uniref:Cobalt-zinc-cadmium efflux system protein n=1 Tax=Conyzicola lurida TaxID=1172621 RepID=A0A841AM04_9MICO|nr:cobalt-zinc-cadmium efflux system protein [Conyzicola lurida]